MITILFMLFLRVFVHEGAEVIRYLIFKRMRWKMGIENTKSTYFTFIVYIMVFSVSGNTHYRTKSKNGITVLNRHDGLIYGMELDKYAIP